MSANVGDAGLVPGPGGFHKLQKSHPCATANEPVLWGLGAAPAEPRHCNYCSLSALEPMVHTRRSQCPEKPTHGTYRKD